MTGIRSISTGAAGDITGVQPRATGSKPGSGALVRWAERVAGVMELGLSTCAAAILGLLLALVLASVGLRYLLATGLVGTEEVAIWLFLALIAVGMPLGLRGPLSMRLDILVRRLPRTLRQLADIGADAVTAAAGLILFSGGGEIVAVMRSVSPVLGLPDGLRFSVLAAG